MMRDQTCVNQSYWTLSSHNYELWSQFPVVTYHYVSGHSHLYKNIYKYIYSCTFIDIKQME